jgi:hypothetical protein
MDFRKGILALAAAGLGLTGVANAQVSCTSASATPAFVRAEGTTELVPALTVSSCSAGASTPSTITITVTSNAGITNQNVANQTYSDATANFFGTSGAANLVNGVLAGGTLTFTATGTQIGSTLASGIVISGVRVNAASIPANQSVTETVSMTTGGSLSNTSNINVAVTNNGVAKPLVEGLANNSICSTVVGTVVPVLQAEVASNFNGSFSTAGKIYVQVTFANLVSGVNYYVPVTIGGAGASVTPSGLTATLVSSNSSTTAVGTTTIGPSGGNQVANVAQVSVSGSSGSALYYLTGNPIASPAVAQAFVVPLYAVLTSSATSGVNTPPTVSEMLMGPSAGGYDQFSSTQTPTAVAAAEGGSASSPALLTGTPVVFPAINITGTAATYGLGELTPCATTLLFPYLVNTGGYDTGVAIVNASGGTPNSAAQSGTCSVQFYGAGAPSTNPYVTSSVASNGIATFVVSGVASGFQGYAIATCSFEYAHAFAFITDGFGSPGRGLSQGYLAPIISAVGATPPTIF